MLHDHQKLSSVIRATLRACAALVPILLGQTAAFGGPADQYREEYVYDELGRLKQKTYLDADLQQREIFTYDAAGNRILKAVAGTFFLIDGDGGFNAETLEQIKIVRAGDLDLAQRIDVTLTDITAAAGPDYLYWLASNPGLIYPDDGVVLTLDFAANETEKVIVLEGQPGLGFGDSLSVALSNVRDFDGSTYVPAANTAIAIPTLTYAANDPDPDAAGPVSFVFVGNVTVAEGSSATVTIKRKGDASTAHNVVVKTIDGSAVAGTDYTAVNTTISFAANERIKTVSVNASTDAASELDETFSTLMISANNGAVIGSPDAGRVTILGTASPPTTVRLMDRSLYEGQSGDLTFIRDGDVSTSQTVEVHLLQATATADSDYITTYYQTCGAVVDCYYGTVSFSPGQRTAGLTIHAKSDSATEGDEYFWVYGKYYNSTTPAFSDPIAKVTIINGTAPATPSPITPSGAVSFGFETAAVTVAEGSTGSVTVTRTGATNSNHTVLVQRVEGTARSSYGSSTATAEDYYVLTASTLYFAPGETSKSISFEALADTLTETDENFMFFIRAADNGAEVGSPQVATVTIPGTGAPSTLGSVRLMDRSLYEGQSGDLTFIRDGDVSTSQTVEVHLLQATATADSDYITTYYQTCGAVVDCYYGTVSFSPGQRTAGLTIHAKSDSATEGDEYFWVYGKYYNSTTPAFSDPIAKVTIINGTAPATPSPITPSGAVSFGFETAAVTVAEGSTGSVTVTRTGATNSNHTVLVQRVEGTARSSYGSSTATAEDYYVLTTSTLYFAPGETSKSISFEALADTLTETDENFMFFIRATDNGAEVGSPQVATVTIPGTGAPSTLGSVRLMDRSLYEGQSGDLTFIRDGDVSTSQTVEVHLLQATATADSDYVTTYYQSCGAVVDCNYGTVSFAPGQRTAGLTIIAKSDSATEGDEYFWVYGKYYNSTTPAFSDPIAKVTIINGTAPATPSPITPSGAVSFGFETAAVTVAEGSTGSVTVTRTGATNSNHTVLVQRVEGTARSSYGSSTATAEDYYVLTTSTLYFAPGETSKSISFEALADTLTETDENFMFFIRAADNGAEVGSPQVATVTIPGTGAPSTLGSVRLMDRSLYEGQSGDLTFIRDGDVSTSQTVEVHLLQATATADSDYVTTYYQSCGAVVDCNYGTVSFAPGQRTAGLTIIAKSDSATEGDEYFWVYGKYYNSTTPAFSDPIAKVTIINGTAPATPSPITPSGAVSFGFETAAVTVAEGSTGSVTVTRTGATNSNHTVLVQRVEGTARSSYGSSTATAEDYYVLTTSTLYFAPGETSKSISFEALADTLTETDENFMFFIRAADNGAEVGSPQVATVTIPGTGAPSTLGSVRLMDRSLYEGQSGDLTFIRDGDVSTSQTVEVHLLQATATADSDYVTTYYQSCGAVVDCNYGTVSFAPGQRTAGLTIIAKSDSATEGDEYFWVYGKYYNSTTPAFSDPIAKVTIINGTAPATPSPITPSGAVSFGFETAAVTVAEGSTGSVTVTRTGATNSNHTVLVQRVEGTARSSYGSSTATAEDYYVLTTSTLYFAPGETSKSISFEALADTLTETDENFMFFIRATDNGAIVGSPDTAEVKITGTTTSPASSISLGNATVTEGGSVAVQLTRTGTITASETVEIHTVIGTAGASDFAQNCGSSVVDCNYTNVSFAANAATTTFTVNATNDSVLEGTEYLWVYARYSSSASQGFTDAVAKVSITDDDTASSLSISDTSAGEGSTATLTVTRSGTGVASWQFVPYAITAGTAAANDDYAPASGYAVFTPGATTATIQIPIAQDTDVEGSEAFTVDLTAADAYTTLSDGSATVTITDDD